ncbi:hypothetical protein J6590_037432 [Homalodisca vitripennis]|nr:hypothetical protein J6590_037432 [Homalodisca vitripennis]
MRQLSGSSSVGDRAGNPPTSYGLASEARRGDCYARWKKHWGHCTPNSRCAFCPPPPRSLAARSPDAINNTGQATYLATSTSFTSLY